MRIGSVAAQSGVSAQTLRFYEKRGILAPPARLTSGYRDYPDDTVRIVRFIRRAQRLGFSLVELRSLVRSGAGIGGNWRRLRPAFERKTAQLERDAQLLQASIAELRSCLESCGCCNPGKPCRSPRSAVPQTRGRST
jgi:MerR family mercuric resistance operon transcriptional regulator